MRYDAIQNSEQYADNESPDSILMQNEECGMQKADKTEKQMIWPEAIFDMINFARSRPQTWEVMEIKLRNPFMSTRQIAQKTGFTQNFIVRHLRESAETFPWLAEVLGVRVKK